jgi:enoyl-CoA hydratase
MSYETLQTSEHKGVGLITLNRPKALNALSSVVCSELTNALKAYDQDEGIAAIIITGSEKAFAAGADVAEMADHSFLSASSSDFLQSWEAIGAISKPIIAAVTGYALGGGAELVYMCDIVVADPTAKFGQPEITLGIIPGMGGTQRLPRIAGKAKAMDLVLTGRMMDAKEAESSGLISRLVETGKALEEAQTIGERIAQLPRLAVAQAKKAINASFEMPLSAGLKQERAYFYPLFATTDQSEGMAAFLEKRTANFNND